MKTYQKLLAVAVLAVAATGCTRVQTGDVGVRIGWDKQIQQGELMPGSFNQTLIGDVLMFPVKNVNATVEDLNPVAKDNSTMKDFDLVVVYNINPQQVSEIYGSMNRGFHAQEHGEIYLMYTYIQQVAKNAVYKSAREYEALTMNDHRQDMEESVKTHIQHSLKDEKLDGVITVSQVLIKNILPADTVVASANELVKAKNELQRKEVEVQTAKKEAERMNALANQSTQSIAYMQAQAALNISEGIKNGKVQTIVVPANFNALMMGK
jgi:regulator of protease activity HflC (stomatin/prohibitin superfamily)